MTARHGLIPDRNAPDQCPALGTCTARPSDPVNVIFVVIGALEIDDQLQRSDVQT